jgi:hypothetical protein
MSDINVRNAGYAYKSPLTGEWKNVYLEDFPATVINMKSFEEQAGKLEEKYRSSVEALNKSFAFYPCGVCIEYRSTLSPYSDHRCRACHWSFEERVQRFK